MWTRERIVAEIKRTAAENGDRPLSETSFHDSLGLKRSQWLGKYWTRWSEAQNEAGVTPTVFANTRVFDKDVVLEKYAMLTRRIGFFPREVDLRMAKTSDASFPSLDTCRSLLGQTKRQRLEAVREYASGIAGYDDIISMCEREVQATLAPKEESPFTANDDGVVYLVRSGKYYKIGRSNSAGRREYEIGLKMPEAVQLIHRINTDDPVGIESYWHRRFAEKRKNGEWFDLDGADIAAFRRRKFM